MELQTLVQKKGEEILSIMENSSKTSLFSKDYWYGAIMDGAMKNDSFKTQMFRFVDVLPSLQSSSEVAKHLKEYFANNSEDLPALFNVGLGLGSLAPSLMASAIKKNVTQMAKMFIAGEDPREAIGTLKKARQNHIAFTVDLLGEATLSEKEAMEYQTRYLELMESLHQESLSWSHHSLLDQDHLGNIPKINISVKMTALFSQINEKNWDFTKKVLKDRLRPLFLKGKELGLFVNLDMEQYAVKNLTIEVFKELISEPELKDYRHFGCVIQAYLKDSLSDLYDLVAFAKARGRPFTLRLVKGAYWDFETIDSQQKGWDIPVYLNKKETDSNFESCMDYLLDHHGEITLAIGSHNVRSIAYAMVQAERRGIPKSGIEIQMLYGMAEPIKKALLELGYRIREYAPVGQMLPGMAYLVRRLLENTSNESWLRGKFAEGKSVQELLANPKVEAREMNFGVSTASQLSPTTFENEPLIDFAIPMHRDSMKAALAELRKTFEKGKPFIVSPYMNGKWVSAVASANSKRKELWRENPARPKEKWVQMILAQREDVDGVVNSSWKAFQDWKKVSPFERAKKVDQLADLIQENRFKWVATQVLEVGKPWSEADADLAEAIDFCRYYAQNMRDLQKPQKVGHAPGESSHYHYQPRGVCVVISPWNFPLAIMTGMCAAALVSGNSVILKPAEQSTWVAHQLMEMILKVDFGNNVVQFLPGIGEEVGAELVQHPLVHTIAFTGSRNVGMQILKSSQVIPPQQKHVKRCIIEMGGKNAIIIDNDADLDEAVKGVVTSAFGFSGQKCSACSRVIVLSEIYSKFVQRLVESTSSIILSEPEDPSCFMGPVVDKEAYQRIVATIEKAKSAGHSLLYQHTIPMYLQTQNGYYVPPTIFGDVSPHSELAQEEIFGPVLAVMKASSMEDAIGIANGTAYALTGGLYSRSPKNIERVSQDFECGNLYINRGITGAMVERHPFGGFKMSGIGSKTGGPDYLRQYMEPRCVTENTLRRGFAPMEEDGANG